MKKRFLIFALLLAGCGAKDDQVQALSPVDPACDAAVRPCEAKGEGGTLTFSVANARTMRPTAVQLAWQGQPAEAVLVNFGMLDMDMGENRYRLLPEGQGRWSGSAVLPVCVKGRSDWIADVKLTEKGGAIRTARFRFTVQP